MAFSASFSVCNSARTDRAFRIFAKPGRLEDLKPLVETMGRGIVPLQAKGEVKNVGFVTRTCPTPAEMKDAAPVIDGFKVKGNTCSGLTLVGQLDGEAALIQVIQEVDGKEIGGLGVLVLNGDIHQPKERHEQEHHERRAK
jgi:hypothetical protein